MKVLFDAIYAHFLSEGKLGLTELYLTEAPDDVVWPYGTFKTNITPGNGEFSINWEDCLITFALFSDVVGHTEVCNLFQALKDAFDKHDLDVIGYEPISLIREPAILRKVKGIWRYDVDYRLLVAKKPGTRHQVSATTFLSSAVLGKLTVTP